MVEKKQVKLSELLCSKLCHDLVSPISAINNGMEFIDEDKSDLNDQAIELIKKSSEQASRKLSYYRVSMGAAAPDDIMKYNDVMELIENFVLDKNLSVGWVLEGYTGPNINKLIGKVLMNLVLICYDTLTRSGHIEITLSEDITKPNITITVSGEICALHKDIKSIFQAEVPEALLTVRNVLAYYCKQLALDSSKTIELKEGKNHISFKVI